jgi:hypothetical protein
MADQYTASVPFRGDRRSLAAAAMVGVAAVVVAIVALTAGPSGGPLPQQSPSARTATPFPLTATPVPKQPMTGFGFSAVDDASARQLVLFGGVDSYSTTWLWDGRRWTLARPPASPPGRFGAAAAYDPLTGIVMLYGGRLGPGQVVNDTWAWDGRTWRQLDNGTGSPPAGEGSTMAWDATLNEMVLVAGDQTWVWVQTRWMRQPKSDLPSGTAIGGLAFDPRTRALLAISCCAPQVTTYTWDGVAWRKIGSSANSPAIVSLAVDPVSNTLLLCSDPTQVTVGHQMWSWTGSAWVALAGAGLPALPQAEVTDVDDGHVLIVASVIDPTQEFPQPVHLWSWTGTTWDQRG